MTEQAQLDLETRLHALICGGPDEPDRADLLRRIAGDQDTRELLAEMLAVQEGARAAVGLTGAAGAMRASLAKVTDGISGASAGADRRPVRRRPSWAGAWLVRAAAAVVIGVSVYLAVSGRLDSRRMREQLAKIARAVSMPRVTAAELVNYRRIWQQVSGPPQAQEPWVLLRNGGGEFGYLPASVDSAAADRLMLLRCVLVRPDGRAAESVNLLLPARRTVRLSLPDVGRLAGEPLRCDIATGKQWASVALSVGDSAGPAGVSGRARTGAGPVEIGQFNFRGMKLRVVLQVVPLGKMVG